MKKHLINILFDLPNGEKYHFVGLVGSVNISPAKLFKNAFGFQIPQHTQITIQ